MGDMRNSYRHGALTVIENVKPKNEIQLELRKIDPRLFLERQVTLEGQAVWCVVCDIGDQPPVTILEWRDSEGHPLPELSAGIIGRVQRMEQQNGNITARVIRANEAKIAEARRTADGHWSDIGKDFERLMSPAHSALLPRGQSLRRSRDKMRSKGFRV
jgi:hypothetical protein